MARKLKDGLDTSVADRLIDAAEELYGEHGLQGVSLRQISISAGTGNNYAVQYHFKDAAGLIQAILTKRAPRVEVARAKLLAKCLARNTLTTRALIDALARPLIEHLNDRGERSLARFMLALCSTPAGTVQLREIEHLVPTAGTILDLIQQANPGIPGPLLHERIRLASHLVLNSVINRLGAYIDEAQDADLIENALDMASAAISAPVGDYARSTTLATIPL